MSNEDNSYAKIIETMRERGAATQVEAGFFIRIVSLVIDIAILTFVINFFGSSISPEAGYIGFKLDITGIMIFFVYFFVFDWSPLKGTLGKMAVGIKVCDEYGERLLFWKSLLRCISRGVTLISFFLGYLTIFFRDDKRALHDIMSSSYVLQKK